MPTTGRSQLLSCFICSLVHTSDHSQQGLLLPWYWSSWIYFHAVAFLPRLFFSRTSACCGQTENFIRRDQNCSTVQRLCSRKDVVVVRQKCAVADLGQGWDKWTPCVPSKTFGLPLWSRGLISSEKLIVFWNKISLCHLICDVMNKTGKTKTLTKSSVGISRNFS